MTAEGVAYAQELFAPLAASNRAAVVARRLFGGHGLSIDGRTFALILDGQLYLKADAENVAQFTAAGCERLSYTARGETRHLNYYLPPEAALESATAMRPWAELAWAAALRKAARQARREQRPRKPRG